MPKQVGSVLKGRARVMLDAPGKGRSGIERTGRRRKYKEQSKRRGRRGIQPSMAKCRHGCLCRFLRPRRTEGKRMRSLRGVGTCSRSQAKMVRRVQTTTPS